MECANLGNRRRRIVALLGGASGSGKTALAIPLAERLGLEILSADSGQSRQGLSIGTAVPSPSDLDRVRHHLLADIAPDAEDSVALYLDRADLVLQSPGPDLLAVGGTGQFLQGLRDGLAPMPPPDPLLRQELSERLRREGSETLWRELADRTEPPHDARANPVRLLRALEKSILSQRGVQGESRPALAPTAQVFALQLEREVLHKRLEKRLGRMLEDGWREEVRHLARLVPDSAPCWKCIGYEPLRATLEFAQVPTGTVRRILEATRQYAKRQETWLRNRLHPIWVEANRPLDPILQDVLAKLETPL